LSESLKEIFLDEKILYKKLSLYDLWRYFPLNSFEEIHFSVD
jgi:hypothetical protein